MSNIKSVSTYQVETLAPAALTGKLVRAGRAMVGITAVELAREATISVATVRRAELDDGPVRMTQANAARIIEAMERLGVVFFGSDADGGPGLRYSAGHHPSPGSPRRRGGDRSNQ